MRQGRLQAQATGYARPEHVRVEILPGPATCSNFVIADRKVEALVHDELRFERAHRASA